ncbi:MAG: FkbM family methyltransferase [Planctomycetota bacterium]|jgi:FkbM family methyltransferase
MSPSILSVPRHVWCHPSNRGQRLRALVRAVAWQVSKRLTGRPKDYRLPSGLCLRVHPDSAAASSVLYASGLPDHDEMRFAADYLRPGDGFADVGANIGSYVLFVAPLTAPSGRVVAFEPGARAHDRLRENVALNRLEARVELRREAASNVEGTARFSTNQDTQNALCSDADPAGEAVPTTRLDDALEGDFALGKLDLEGAECLALDGAARRLAEANPPVWLLEMNRVALRRFGTDEERLARQLDEAGFDLFTYDPNTRTLAAVPRPIPAEHSNLVAVARARLDEVRARLDGRGETARVRPLHRERAG